MLVLFLYILGQSDSRVGHHGRVRAAIVRLAVVTFSRRPESVFTPSDAYHMYSPLRGPSDSRQVDQLVQLANFCACVLSWARPTTPAESHQGTEPHQDNEYYQTVAVLAQAIVL